jgi:hypothetical protein
MARANGAGNGSVNKGAGAGSLTMSEWDRGQGPPTLGVRDAGAGGGARRV